MTIVSAINLVAGAKCKKPNANWAAHTTEVDLDFSTTLAQKYMPNIGKAISPVMKSG